MSLIKSPHRNDLREAGWHTRGYLPHFDGLAIPQFITLRLFDSVPDTVLQRWMRELDVLNSKKDQIILQKRIEKYIDQGYGEAFLKIHRVAEMVQKELLYYDGRSYRLSAWVVMPNHIHLLMTALTQSSWPTLCSRTSRSRPTKLTRLFAARVSSGWKIISTDIFEMQNIWRRRFDTLKTIL